jgi:hypothetical protein
MEKQRSLLKLSVAGMAMSLLAVGLMGCAEEKGIKPAPVVVESKYVNEYCPIMGGPIDPAKVPQTLVREYKGKMVAFCCPGCPENWDKLTDAQKDQVLAKAGPDEEHARKVHGWRWVGGGKGRMRVKY